MPRVRPISLSGLASELADRLLATTGRVRVAIDGATAVAPGVLAVAIADRLRVAGRFAVHVSTDDFLLPASQRYEFGRTSPESFYEGWRDGAGLRREVLEAAVDGRVLPALWRTDIDRSARAAYVDLPPDAVVLVSGEFLLGGGLPFDLEVHLEASDAALARRTPADEHWTLPAYTRYRDEVMPAEFAHVVVRMEDPRHPALVEPD
jgi:hypothetical protein